MLVQATWATYSAGSLPTQWVHTIFYERCPNDELLAANYWQNWEDARKCIYLGPGLICKKKADNKWWLSLGPLENRAVLLWPLQVFVSGDTTFAVPKAAPLTRPEFQDAVVEVCTSLQDWEACSCTMAGPAHFVSHESSAATSSSSSSVNVPLPPAIRF